MEFDNTCSFRSSLKQKEKSDATQYSGWSLLVNTLSNLHSEKNAKQGFEMPSILENVVFCEYLWTDQ